MPSFTEEGEIDASEGICEQRDFRLGRRSYRYNSYDATIDPDAYREKLSRLPSYAVKRPHEAGDYTDVSWKVVIARTFDDYEWLFDYVNFIPSDGPLDVEALHSEKSALTAGKLTAVEEAMRDIIARKEVDLTTTSAIFDGFKAPSSDWADALKYVPYEAQGIIPISPIKYEDYASLIVGKHRLTGIFDT